MINKKTLLLTLVLFIQIGCGKSMQVKTFSDPSQLATCMSGELSNNCSYNSAVLDQKVSEAEKALIEAESVVTFAEPDKLISDPSKLLNNKSFRNLIDKIKAVISKVDSIQSEIDGYISGLDPSLHSDLIAKLQKIRDRLSIVKNSVTKAKERLLVSVDKVITKVEGYVNKLNPIIRFALSSKIDKVMNYLYDFRRELAAII